MGNLGVPTAARESKPVVLFGALERLSQRVTRLEDLISDLRGGPERAKTETVNKAQAEPNNFEYVYNLAPKFLEEQIARIENVAGALRDILI